MVAADAAIRSSAEGNMTEKTYRWVSVLLMAGTLIGSWWTRHDVAVLSGRVNELSEGHRELVSALVHPVP